MSACEHNRMYRHPLDEGRPDNALADAFAPLCDTQHLRYMPRSTLRSQDTENLCSGHSPKAHVLFSN